VERALTAGVRKPAAGSVRGRQRALKRQQAKTRVKQPACRVMPREVPGEELRAARLPAGKLRAIRELRVADSRGVSVRLGAVLLLRVAGLAICRPGRCVR
jgi:hypothetical protein